MPIYANGTEITDVYALNGGGSTKIQVTAVYANKIKVFPESAPPEGFPSSITDLSLEHIMSLKRVYGAPAFQAVLGQSIKIPSSMGEIEAVLVGYNMDAPNSLTFFSKTIKEGINDHLIIDPNDYITNWGEAGNEPGSVKYFIENFYLGSHALSQENKYVRPVIKKFNNRTSLSTHTTEQETSRFWLPAACEVNDNFGNDDNKWQYGSSYFTANGYEDEAPDYGHRCYQWFDNSGYKNGYENTKCLGIWPNNFVWFRSVHLTHDPGWLSWYSSGIVNIDLPSLQRAVCPGFCVV